ncbi:MAG: hypothetical protein R3D28_05695 [Geminicoccaceae bacterium]
MGKATPETRADLLDLSVMLDAGIQGVKARGKAVGMKAVLDVLCPGGRPASLVDQNETDGLDERIIAAAGHALHAPPTWWRSAAGVVLRASARRVIWTPAPAPRRC